MGHVRIALARITGWLKSRRADRELRRELQSHLAEATEDYLAQGLSPSDARRAALRHFGGLAQIEEAYRDQLFPRWFDQLRSDLRYGVRALLKSPGFSLVVILVLALGTGAVTSVFVLLNGIVLAPLPFSDSKQLVAIEHTAPGLNRSRVGISSGLYYFYTERSRSVEAIGVYRNTVQDLQMPGAGKEQTQVTYASATIFDVLRTPPLLGRVFTQEDGGPGFMDTTWAIPVILSHDLWIEKFGGSPDIIGRTIMLSDRARTIVGVMPQGFMFPDRHTRIWMLMEPPRATANVAGSFSDGAIARLQPGVNATAAQAEMTGVLPQIVGAFRDATPQRLAESRIAPLVTPLQTAMVADVAPVLWTLFAGMVLLLTIAAANVASLFTVRAEHRRREIAVRQALGASRGRIVVLFFVEALLLTTASAMLGLLVAHVLLLAVAALAPVELPRFAEVQFDALSIACAGGTAVLMAALYAVMSIRRQARALTAGLAGGGHWATRSHGIRGNDPMVVLQVTLALSLMVGSALMVKTFRNLSHVELGFTPDHMLVMDVSLPYRLARRHAQIYEQMTKRVRALPGVESASAASFVPLTHGADSFPVAAGSGPVPFKFFIPGYFQTMKTPVVHGDAFGAGETGSAAHPVLVSATLARRLYPAVDAIGRPIQRLNEDWTVPSMRSGPIPAYTIAGIVGDARETTLRGEPSEVVYVPVVEPNVEVSIVPTDMALVVRTKGDPLSLVPSVRAAVAEAEPGLSIGKVRTMDDVVGAARGRETFVGTLLLLAATMSLVLGVIGVYGAIAHVVRSRTREIGIRIALGARPVEVMRIVTMGSLSAVLIGTAAGTVIALLAATTLRSLLFKVTPHDPAVFLVVIALLLISTMAAAWIAARRAATIAPLVAMRSE